MRLDKWASKLTPAIPSELVLDAFELAMEIRYVDMRASHYDVTSFDLDPIEFEIADGTREYARLQSNFAARGANLRARTIAAIEALLL